jgi:hypothetical protein
MARWYIDENGYRRFSDSGELVHRWVAKKEYGLGRGGVVHHMNRDKTDNHPDNLWVFKNQKQHDRAHRKDKWW